MCSLVFPDQVLQSFEGAWIEEVIAQEQQESGQ